MASHRGPIRSVLEASLALVALGPLRLLPSRAARVCLRGLGDLGYLCLSGRRKRALGRVRQTLGLEGRAARRVVRGSFRNLATNVLEAGRLARALEHHDVRELVTVEGEEHVRSALERGQGLLLVGAHLGAWEAAPLAMARLFKPIWAVARPLDNRLLERMALRLRGEVLAGSLGKGGSAWAMARLLRRGEMVGLLLDQNAGSSGVLLPFLGLPCRQHRVAGALGVRFGAAVLPSYMLREPGGRAYRLVLEPPVIAPPGLGAEEAEREVLLALSRSLERQVLAHPEQWNWLHDRWLSAEVALFLARKQRERAKTASDSALAAGTNEVL